MICDLCACLVFPWLGFCSLCQDFPFSLGFWSRLVRFRGGGSVRGYNSLQKASFTLVLVPFRRFLRFCLLRNRHYKNGICFGWGS